VPAEPTPPVPPSQPSPAPPPAPATIARTDALPAVADADAADDTRHESSLDSFVDALFANTVIAAAAIPTPANTAFATAAVAAPPPIPAPVAPALPIAEPSSYDSTLAPPPYQPPATAAKPAEPMAEKQPEPKQPEPKQPEPKQPESKQPEPKPESKKSTPKSKKPTKLKVKSSSKAPASRKRPAPSESSDDESSSSSDSSSSDGDEPSGDEKSTAAASTAPRPRRAAAPPVETAPHPFIGGKKLVQLPPPSPLPDDAATDDSDKFKVPFSGSNRGTFTKAVTAWHRAGKLQRSTGLTACAFHAIAAAKYAADHPEPIEPGKLRQADIFDALDDAWIDDEVYRTLPGVMDRFAKSLRVLCHSCSAPATVLYTACGHLAECGVCSHHYNRRSEFTPNQCPVCEAVSPRRIWIGSNPKSEEALP
jgi:hypothetical protein